MKVALVTVTAPADVQQAQRVGAAGDVHLIDRDRLRQARRLIAGIALGVKFTALTAVLFSSVTVPGQRRARPREDRQAVQGEGRALPVQRLVGVQRDIAGSRRPARVDVDDWLVSDGVGGVREELNGLCDRPSPLPPALFTYQTMLERLMVTVPVLVTPLPSVSV